MMNKAKASTLQLLPHIGEYYQLCKPKVVYLILFTAALLAWSILIPAPIEEPGALARTPNPSKAPWYFLGLQELLRYISPFVAGILVPISLVIALIYLRKGQRLFRPLLVVTCSWLTIYLVLSVVALTAHG